jgi:hypothetical protein
MTMMLCTLPAACTLDLRGNKGDGKEAEDTKTEGTASAQPAATPAPANSGTQPADLKLEDAVNQPALMPGAEGGNLDYVTVPGTHVQIPFAPGWRKTEAGLYKVAVAPSNDAALAFSTIGSRGELAGRLQQIAGILKINDLRRGPSKTVDIGPDKLRAYVEDGSCRFGNRPGVISTVVVDAGGSRPVVVVYAVEAAAAQTVRRQALAMVLLMRRAR